MFTLAMELLYVPTEQFDVCEYSVKQISSILSGKRTTNITLLIILFVCFYPPPNERGCGVTADVRTSVHIFVFGAYLGNRW